MGQEIPPRTINRVLWKGILKCCQDVDRRKGEKVE